MTTASVTPLPHVEHHGDRDTPQVALPAPDEVLAWCLRVLGELGRAPFTLYRFRQMISALLVLPDQIEALTRALERTTDTLEVSLANMDHRLEELQGTFLAVDGRIGNLEGTVGELTTTVTRLVGAIPGVRRSLRN